MNPLDDDPGVSDARDEGVIAGRAVAPQDAALAALVAELREGATVAAPEPTPALAALLSDGLAGGVDGADDATNLAPTADVVALSSRRRRRALRYVVGGSVAAALALGGSAAAAAVRDGVPFPQLPGAIGERVVATVGDALEAVGLRHRPPADGPAPGPPHGPATPPSDEHGSQRDVAPVEPVAPNPSREVPGRPSEAPGRSTQEPGGASEAPGRSQDAPGRDQGSSTHPTEPGTVPDPGRGAGNGRSDGQSAGTGRDPGATPGVEPGGGASDGAGTGQSAGAGSTARQTDGALGQPSGSPSHRG